MTSIENRHRRRKTGEESPWEKAAMEKDTYATSNVPVEAKLLFA